MKNFFEAVWFALVNLVLGFVHGQLSWSANPDNRRAVYFGRRTRPGWYGVDPIFTLVFDHDPRSGLPYVSLYVGIGRGSGYMKGWGRHILIPLLPWKHKASRFRAWVYKWQEVARWRLSPKCNFVAGTWRSDGRRLHGLSATRTAKPVVYRSRRISVAA